MFFVAWAHFFLALNVLLSGCTIAYLSTHLLKDTLAVMNKIAMNTGMQVLYGYTFSTYLDKYQGMWFIDCVISISRNFLRRRNTCSMRLFPNDETPWRKLLKCEKSRYMKKLLGKLEHKVWETQWQEIKTHVPGWESWAPAWRR